MSIDQSGPKVPVRLFSDLDTGKTEREKGSKYGDETGIRAIEKKSAGLFAKKFGKEIIVGGKTYIISRQSLKAFVARNPALFSLTDEKAPKGLKIDQALQKLQNVSNTLHTIFHEGKASNETIKILCHDVLRLTDIDTQTILNTKDRLFPNKETLNRTEVLRLLFECKDVLEEGAVSSPFSQALVNSGILYYEPHEETDIKHLLQSLANISTSELTTSGIRPFQIKPKFIEARFQTQKALPALLANAKTKEAVLQTIREHKEKNPNAPCLQGDDYNHVANLIIRSLLPISEGGVGGGEEGWEDVFRELDKDSQFLVLTRLGMSSSYFKKGTLDSYINLFWNDLKFNEREAYRSYCVSIESYHKVLAPEDTVIVFTSKLAPAKTAKAIAERRKTINTEALREVYKLFTGNEVRPKTIKYLCSDILKLNTADTEKLFSASLRQSVEGKLTFDQVKHLLWSHRGIIQTSSTGYQGNLLSYLNDVNNEDHRNRFAVTLREMLGGVEVDVEMLASSQKPLSREAQVLKESLEQQKNQEAAPSYQHTVFRKGPTKPAKRTLNKEEAVQTAMNIRTEASEEMVRNNIFNGLDRNSQFLVLQRLSSSRLAAEYANKFWDSMQKNERSPYIELLRESGNYPDILPTFR